MHRTDGDFPVAWTKTYGKGRVFYSTLGHSRELWDTPWMQKMYFESAEVGDGGQPNATNIASRCSQLSRGR